MKKWIFLILVLVVAGGVWTHQSIYWSLVSLERAAADGDVNGVERYVKLSAVVDATGVFIEVAAEDGLKDATGSDLIGKIGGAFARGLASAAIESGKGDAVMELKRKIGRREAFTSWGPFKPDEENLLKPRERLGDTWLVELHGTCGGNPASVDVVFTRQSGPLNQDWLGYWRATELRRSSLLELVKACNVKAAG